MGYTAFYKGIAFIEGEEERARIIARNQRVELMGIGSHLKSLDDVKEQFTRSCAAAQANAVVNFKYGQKARWLAIGDVSFWGSGDLAFVDHETIAELREKYS